MSNHGWPAEHVAVLRKMEGRSSSEILRELKKLRPGVTRSAVVAKCHRLGVKLSPGVSKAQRSKNKRAGLPRIVRESRRASKSTVPTPPDYGRADAWRPLDGVTPVDLASRLAMQCAWPVGEPARPADQLYCGAAVPDGVLPYCCTHRRMRLSEHPLTDLQGLARAAA